MSTQIDSVLQELTSKPIGIQGAVLVSSEGQPITMPIGINENSALILAGTMLYLAKSTSEEFSWSNIEAISVRSQQGHVILAPCTETAFLLVQAGKVLTGLLEGEINRTLKKLQIQFNSVEEYEPDRHEPAILSAKPALDETRELDREEPVHLSQQPELEFSNKNAQKRKYRGVSY